jgi:opacity protein-like surface antigen
MRNRILLLAALLTTAATARAQTELDEQPFGIGLETGGVWFSRNDIRIPSDTGDEFDMTKLTGSGPDFFARLDGHWNINDKHGFRIVLAPLEVSGTGDLREDTEFAGEIFSAGATEGTYKFNAYKITYRYTFVDNPTLRWRVGFTGVIRDANVELRQGSLQANDDNVGFVPALHLSSDYRFAERWMLRFDFDGLAGGPGRLFDVALKLDYAVNDNWRIGGGYRTLEGGADTDDVYSFGWLHYAVIDLRYRF